MKKILLIGNGAREHAVAEALAKSPSCPQIHAYGATKNPGIAALAHSYQIGKLDDKEAICAFALGVKPDFAFIGPENPIAIGVADALLEKGIKSVAPLKTVARLESSKAFTRQLVQKYAIAGNPRFRVFRAENSGTEEAIKNFLAELGEDYVVKADGLEGGKGVMVAGEHLKNQDEALAFALKSLAKHGETVIEEKLKGVEFSLMSFVDGETVLDLPPVQDHKRAYEGDQGPNTGGMGTYTDADLSLPFLTPADLRQAHEITVKVMEALELETGVKFTGIMFGGFMATKEGVKLIEYNARFGDPEAINVLALLKNDFYAVCAAIIAGDLKNIRLEFEQKATVCKYAVPDGYPDNPLRGEKISIGQLPAGVKVFYAAVEEKSDGLYLTGSRALAFLGAADTIEAAALIADQGLKTVSGPVFYRKDIGTKALVQEKVAMLKKLRAE